MGFEGLTADELNTEGNQALGSEDFATAIQCYTEGLARDDDLGLHPVLLSNRSSAYAHCGQWKMALRDADMCIDLRPTWPRAHACRGAALEGMDMLTEAFEAFKTAHKLSPSNHELADIIVEIEQALGKQQEKYESSGTTTDPARQNPNEIMSDPSAHKVAGVGMHIMHDNSSEIPCIKIVDLADWSPLTGHVLPGDTIEAIDGKSCSTMLFEQASAMIIGRPGDMISLEFRRPNSAARPRPWRMTIPRVLPHQRVRSETFPHRPAPIPKSQLDVVSPEGKSYPHSGKTAQGIRVVFICEEVWNLRYRTQDEADADYKLKMVEDVSSAVDVSPGRLHVYKVETSKNSIRAHMVIYPSLAAGSGIPSIEPRDSRDITLDLIAQGSDPKSRLRTAHPAIVEVRFEGASFTDAAFVPKDTERSDEVLMRNFISELQTLTLFLEASHDDELLCQYSKEGDKMKPPDVLKPYEAADRLKRAHVKLQVELEELKHTKQSDSLDQVVKERDRLAQEIVELHAQLEAERKELLHRYEIEKKEIRSYMMQQDQELAQAKHAYQHQKDCVEVLQAYISENVQPKENLLVLPQCPPVHWSQGEFLARLQKHFAKVVGDHVKDQPSLALYANSEEPSDAVEKSPPLPLTHSANSEEPSDAVEKSPPLPLTHSPIGESPPHGSPDVHSFAKQQQHEGDEEASIWPDQERRVDVDGRPLPPGWSHEEHDGQLLYVDHVNRRYCLVHPADLPRSEEHMPEPITNSQPGKAHVPGSSLSRSE